VNAQILEVVEEVDDTPLIPAQAIQFRHHQFVTINQGIERCLELWAILLNRPGANGFLEDHRTRYRLQCGDLNVSVLVGGGATGVSNASGGHCSKKRFC